MADNEKQKLAEQSKPSFADKLTLGTLGLWNYYFLLKFILLWRGNINFHIVENLGFIAFLMLPFDNAWLRKIKNILAVFIGLSLFYYDSWLPPISRLLDTSDILSNFSLIYFAELLARLFQIEMLALLGASWIGYQYLNRIIKMHVLVILGFSFVGWQQIQQHNNNVLAETLDADQSQNVDFPVHGVSDKALDKMLNGFFMTEKQRSVLFNTLPGAKPDFDVLLLNVCSLSWDDLEFTGLIGHPVLEKFDIILENFSTAASYSGPASIRLLRAACGQQHHDDLYAEAPPQCYLFDALKNLGFDTEFYMNHDGHFDNYANLMRTFGHMHATPQPLDGLDVKQNAFDNSPIYGDYDLLSQWLDNREVNLFTAAFYNSISLHDGNRIVGQGSNLNSIKNFHSRLSRFLEDLDKFFKRLEMSGRRVLVLMVPEHGAAVRGDAMQLAGLREIPSPDIVRAPVGIKLFGKGLSYAGAQIKVNAPTSYLAVSHIIDAVIAQKPFSETGQYAPQLVVSDIPQTRFVAENEGTVVAKNGNKFFVRFEGEEWMEYPDR